MAHCERRGATAPLSSVSDDVRPPELTPAAGGSEDGLRQPQRQPPVDRRLQYWPVIHCELCGAVAIAALPSSQFCIACGIYVCAGCWREPVLRCSICEPSVPRPSKRLHVWTLRRADRRLREVITELAEPDDDTEGGWDKRAQAVIKIEGSLVAARAALAHLPRAREQARIASLLARIQRDRTAAVAALERARVVTRRTRRIAPLDATRRSIASWSRLVRESHDRRTGVAAAAAAAVLAVLAGWSLIDMLGDRSTAEGVLSGGPRDAEVASGPSSESGGGPSPTATPSVAGQSLALFEFDARQMGSGLGAGWRDAGGGEVSVAAFPTGVDRSARLVADGATPAITCRTFEAGALAIQVDVFLDPRVPVAARVELTNAAAGARVAIDLSEARTVVSIAGEVVEAAGVQPGQWMHVELRSEDGGAAWQVNQRGVLLAQGRSEGRALEDVTEICLGAEARAGGTAHYDNLAIRWTSG